MNHLCPDFPLKKITVLFMLMTIGSCAGSKKNVYSPAGIWEYVAYSTPVGDSTGQIILVETENGIRGTIVSNGYGESTLENVVFGEEGAFSCNFYMAEIDIYLKGNFDGDSFSGTIDLGQQGSFEMKATRPASL